MSPIAVGNRAPSIPGVDYSVGPTAVFLFKIDCPVARAASPKAQALAEAYPGHVVGAGQDSEENLRAFAAGYGWTFPWVADPNPFRLSDAFQMEVAPTLYLVGTSGEVVDSVVSWDREGYNRISRRLSELTRLPYQAVSEPGDGLPVFRPG